MKTYFTLIIIGILSSFLSGCSDKRHHEQFTYPDGKMKALIMSYDDGPIEDVQFANLLDQHNLVGTFNLNSAYLGTTRGWGQPNADTIYQEYISVDKMLVAFKNHEIAAHGSYHKNFIDITLSEVNEEITSDIKALEKHTGTTLKSMAYPFGNANDDIAEIVKSTKLTNARTVDDTFTFDLPENYYLWDPTCHDSRALDYLDSYVNLNSDQLSLFYVWGHSWEFKDPQRWNAIVTFCKTIANNPDIWYVGSGEYTDYQWALKQLIIADGKIINPATNSKVWIKIKGETKTLQPGESIEVTIL